MPEEMPPATHEPIVDTDLYVLMHGKYVAYIEQEIVKAEEGVSFPGVDSLYVMGYLDALRFAQSLYNRHGRIIQVAINGAFSDPPPPSSFEGPE